MLVHHKGKDDLMGPQQGDERQGGLGKSEGRVEVSFWTSPMTSSPLPVLPTPTRPGIRVTDTLPPQMPWDRLLEGEEGEVEPPPPSEAHKLPRFRDEGKPWGPRPGPGGRRSCRVPSSAPQDLRLCWKEGPRVPRRASSVTSPALDVRLAHEIGFQFGHHNADDSDKDEEVHLQGR